MCRRTCALSQYGQTPLSLAAEHGQAAVVQLLLERGADKDAKSNVRAPPTARFGVGVRAHL